jgi:two-component system nitrate/nitrite response regulator NarL
VSESLYRLRGGRRQAELTKTSVPSVYIASDVRLYREALASGLVGDGVLRVAGQGPCAQALHDVARLRPDVLLLDLASPNSLAAPRAALAIAPDLRVVAFAVSEVEADVLACAEAGICAYVAKEGTVAEVVATVLRALSGELVCPPRIAALLFNRVAKLAAGGPVSDDTVLTTREQEIAGLLVHGLSNKHIARRLGLAHATVKNHVHNVLQKLNVERRGEIAALRRAAGGWVARNDPFNREPAI